MNLADHRAITMQLVMLLTYLPYITVLAVCVLWALLRLHQRPRSGWIMLGAIALSVLQLSGISALWSMALNFGFPISGDVLNLIYVVVNSALEIVISWLLLLGLFGPDPFRWRGHRTGPASEEYDLP
jgi:hypothetical protein